MHTFEWSAEERRRLYIRGLGIRAGAAAVFLAFFTILWGAGPAQGIAGFGEILVVLVFLIAVNPFLWMIGEARAFPLSQFYAHWAMDLLAVTIIVVALGIFDIPLTAFAYVIMITSSATFATRRTSLLLAVAASICFVSAAGAESLGLLEHRHVAFAYHYSAAGKWFLGAATVVILLVFGILAGDLAELLRTKAEELEKGRIELRGAFDKERAARSNLALLSMIVQHDVYSPLSVVSAAAAIVVQSIEKGAWEEVRRYVKMIDDRLESIESAVRTLGSFAEEAADEGTVHPSLEIAEVLLRDLATEIHERQVKVEITGEWPLVNVGYAELYHVLRNLLTNAVKAVEQGGNGKVVLNAVNAGDNVGWRISVSDNGAGVDDDMKKTLLTKRLERLSDSRPGGGFGMGLTLSRNLVQGWGGSISVDTASVGGSRFVVTIPSRRLATGNEDRVLSARHQSIGGSGEGQ